jgi:hypothetical protein
MPQARVKACDASLPQCVDFGNDCFKIRRTQANGGSNSIVEGAALVGASVEGTGELIVDCCIEYYNIMMTDVTYSNCNL